MFAAYWFGKLALYLVLGVVRLVPVVGYRASERYENRLFRPVEESFRATSLSTSTTDDAPPSVELVVTFENGCRFDAEIDGLTLRVGLREEGGTLRTLTWVPAIEAPPTNVEVEPIPAGDEGTLRAEFVAPERDTGTLWLDGDLVVELGFELRGHQFTLGTRTLTLPPESVDVESQPNARRLDCRSRPDRSGDTS